MKKSRDMLKKSASDLKKNNIMLNKKGSELRLKKRLRDKEKKPN
jgi:hypothetical protein